MIVNTNDLIETEFGIGVIEAITEEYIIVKTFGATGEVAIEKDTGVFSVPAFIKDKENIKNNTFMNISSLNIHAVDINDDVYVDNDLFGKIVCITEKWVIVKNDKGESPVHIEDSSFYISHDVEFGQ